MEYLFIILILVSLTIYVFLLFNRQIINRKCLIKKKSIIEKYNKKNYSHFTRPNLEINNILESVNKDLNKKFSVETPLRDYTYSKNNLEDDIKNYNNKIIGKVLNNINKKFNTRYKLLNIESINRKIDIINNEELTIIFLIHEVDKFSTRKLVLNYFKDSKNNIKYNFIKSLHSLREKSPKANLEKYNRESIVKYSSIGMPSSTNKSYTKTILDNDMKYLEKIGAVQEPCKYDLDIWDKKGVNMQFKLNKKCTGINHSGVILSKQPYVNPTLFRLN